MKTAFILFGLGILWLLAFPFGRAYINLKDLQKNGAQSALVQEDIKRHKDVVVDNGPDVRRKIRLEYFKKLDIPEGFRLVHDPKMGDEVVLIGPKKIVDIIYFNGTAIGTLDRNGPRFNKPVRLQKDIEMRINLDRHHVGHPILSFYNASCRDYKPNFTTLGPIKANKLTIDGRIISEKPIQLAVDELMFKDYNSCATKEKSTAPPATAFQGYATQISSFNLLSGIDMTQLEAERYTIYYHYMRGRKINFNGIPKLEIAYAHKESFDENENKIPLIPDTVIVDPGTTVIANYTDGEEQTPMEELVVIEQNRDTIK